MEESRFLKKGCAKKVIPWHCQKKLMASLSNLTLNHSFSTAIYKRKISSLLRNNKWLAKALENCRCELAEKENVVVENEKNLDIINFSKVKLIQMSDNMKKATSCLEETLSLLALQVLNRLPKGIQSSVNPRRHFQNKLRNLDIDPIEEEAEDLENMDTDSIVEKNKKSTSLRKQTSVAKGKNKQTSSKNPAHLKSTSQKSQLTAVSGKTLAKNQKKTCKVSPVLSSNIISCDSENPNEHPVTSTFKNKSRKKPLKPKTIISNGTNASGALKNGLPGDVISLNVLPSVKNTNDEIIKDVINDISNAVVIRNDLPNQARKNRKSVCSKIKDVPQEVSAKKQKSALVPYELESIAHLDAYEESLVTKLYSAPNRTSRSRTNACPKKKDVSQEVSAKKQKSALVPYVLQSIAEHDEPEEPSSTTEFDSSKNSITNDVYDVNSKRGINYNAYSDVLTLNQNDTSDFNICYSQNINCVSDETQYETILRSRNKQTNKTVRFQFTESYGITSSQWNGASEHKENPSQNPLTITDISKTVQGCIDDITMLKDNVSSTNAQPSVENPFKSKSVMQVCPKNGSIEKEFKGKKVNKQLKIRTPRKRPLKEHKIENSPVLSSNHAPLKKRAVSSGNEVMRYGGEKESPTTFVVTAEVHQPPEGYDATKKTEHKLIKRCQNMQPSVVLTDIFDANKAVIESIFNISRSECNLEPSNQFTGSELCLQSVELPMTTDEGTANSHFTEKEAMSEKEFEEQKSKNRRRSKISSYKEPALNIGC